MRNPFAALASILHRSVPEAEQWANFQHAARMPRNLRKGLKRLLPSRATDFSSDSRQQRFRDEAEKQFLLVTAKFGVSRRERRLLARRRARAVLRGEQVPQL